MPGGVKKKMLDFYFLFFSKETVVAFSCRKISGKGGPGQKCVFLSFIQYSSEINMVLFLFFLNRT